MALSPDIISALAPISVVGAIAWVTTTWLKVKNGYPLESSWGKPLLPMKTNEQTERVRLISQENAQLKAELGAVKDRLQVLERIATDRRTHLAAEIDDLRGKPLN